MPGENIIFPYSSYGSPKMAKILKMPLMYVYDRLFSSVAIKLCPSAYFLVLEHATMMRIHKTVPGEKFIFQYSKYGPKKGNK